MMECIASGRLDSEKCHCPVCSRSYKKPALIVQPEKFDDIHEVPFGEGLLVLLQRLTSARLVQPVRLNIPETFFFKNSKVHSYYYTNAKGELCLFSGGVNLKQVQSIIMSSRYRDVGEEEVTGPPLPSPSFSEMDEKEQRQKKMKNDVALLKQLNGGYSLVSEFNLPFEVQKARHIQYLQLYRKTQAEFVKFDYQTDKENELYDRAYKYALTMKGECTDWDRDYIGKEDETTFELELFSKDQQSLLQYLTFKLVQLLQLTSIKVLKCRFDWTINTSTSTISLSNVEGLQYCAARPSSKIDLQTFEQQRRNETFKKIAALATPQRKTHYEWNHRVDNYKTKLYGNYEKVKNNLVKDKPQLEEVSMSDKAFKILHPQMKVSLSEVLKGESLCRRTMRSLFPKDDRPRSSFKSLADINPIIPQTTKTRMKFTWRKRQQESMERKKTLFRQSFRRNLKGSRLQTQHDLEVSTIQVNLTRVLQRVKL